MGSTERTPNGESLRAMRDLIFPPTADPAPPPAAPRPSTRSGPSRPEGGRDVFVCHASTDALHASALVAALEPGVRCWVAPRDIPPGFSFAGGIVEGLERARMVVVLFSADADRSPYVLREVELAVSTGRPILPVRVVDAVPSADLRLLLGVSQWYDAFTGDFADHLPRIRSAVEVRLATAPAAAPPAG